MSSAGIWPYSGLRRDGKYQDASGADNWEALQAMIDHAAGVGIPRVPLPAGGGYVIRRKIRNLCGVTIAGEGALAGNGVVMPTPIIWGGAPDEDMMELAPAAQNAPGTLLENVTLTGRTDGQNLPRHLLVYTGSNGQPGLVDSGTKLREVWLQCSAKSAIRMNGATNFEIQGGRMDRNGEYGIDALGPVSLTIGNQFTWAQDGSYLGFLRLAGGCDVRLTGIHLEVNTAPKLAYHRELPWWRLEQRESFPAGVYPSDRRGLIALKVDPRSGGLTHKVWSMGLRYDAPFNLASHCLFQVVADDPAAASVEVGRRASILSFGAMGVMRRGSDTSTAAAIDAIEMLGGQIPELDRPPVDRSGNCDLFIHNPGLNTATEHGWGWVNSGRLILNAPMLRPKRFAELHPWPQEGMEEYVVDCVTDVRHAAAAGGGNKRVRLFYRDRWLVA